MGDVVASALERLSAVVTTALVRAVPKGVHLVATHVPGLTGQVHLDADVLTVGHA